MIFQVFHDFKSLLEPGFQFIDESLYLPFLEVGLSVFSAGGGVFGGSGGGAGG